MTSQPLDTFWQLELNQELNLYFLLNSLDIQKPVEIFYKNDWVEMGRPLYIQTPMESIIKASPWLIKVKPACLAEVKEWISIHQTSWGWSYYSQQDWEEQLAHWKLYLRANINKQFRALRFYDPRVLGLWLDIDEPELWHYLLAPVEYLLLSSGQVYSRPAYSALPLTPPWSVPQSLLDAWANSQYGIKVTASNLAIQLWETNPEKAEYLTDHYGNIEALLVEKLTELVQKHQSIAEFSLEQLISSLPIQPITKAKL